VILTPIDLEENCDAVWHAYTLRKVQME